MAFLSNSVCPSCSLFLKERLTIQSFSGKMAFRKSSNKGLLASSPNIFLNPKSVNGFIYFAFISNSFHKITIYFLKLNYFPIFVSVSHVFLTNVVLPVITKSAIHSSASSKTILSSVAEINCNLIFGVNSIAFVSINFVKVLNFDKV